MTTLIEAVLYSTAKRLAWDDLDNDDKRMYLREAQKKMAKDKHWLIEECPEEIEKAVSKYDTKQSKKNKNGKVSK